jgi:non-ribosomal peptide synthetase component F
MLSAEERHKLLVEWNATEADAPHACLHELFEAEAVRRPHEIALVDGDRRLSFGELNTRANRLAHHLRERGVRPEVLVAICLERSAELVVALLATLKAGGAYVPLDPDYPRERLAFMLEDPAAPVLVSEASLRPRLPTYTHSKRAPPICGVPVQQTQVRRTYVPLKSAPRQSVSAAQPS